MTRPAMPQSARSLRRTDHDARRRACLRAACAWGLVGAVPGRTSAAGARVVEDFAGRRVALPERIERIASVGGSPAVNAFLFLFGLGARIINGLPAAFGNDAWRYQRVFAPGIERKPVVSGPPPAWAPNIEALLAAAPDLGFVVDVQAARVLERAGIPAVVIDWYREDAIARTVALLGQITGDAARARDYEAWRTGLLARIAARVGAVPAERRPRVLYCRYGSLTQPIMAPANHLIALAGGRSVTEGSNPLGLDVFPFSVEQVLAWQPEVVLLAFGAEREQALADARFAQVPAFRDRRVHAVPHGAHIWTHYTPEEPLGALWLARLLHPHACADLDVEREAKEFYARFFGHALPDADIARILHKEPK